MSYVGSRDEIMENVHTLLNAKSATKSYAMKSEKDYSGSLMVHEEND